MKRSKNTIPFLTKALVFPPVGYANSEGLLAVGGDLSIERLLLGYRKGIFPWFNDDSLILWWSPDPRMVLHPSKIRISRSMRKIMDSGRFSFSRNQAFKSVLQQCATIERKGQPGTWITPDMQKAYLALHNQGIAVSYETWEGDQLVGGLYGIDLGHVFCGESMFHSVSNASKFAFIMMAQELARNNYQLVDCQVYNPHLESLGAEEMSRDEFIAILERNKH